MLADYDEFVGVANGVPLAGIVAGANRNDFKLARETLDSIVIGHPTRTRRTPQGLCLDKGYDYGEVRDLVEEFASRHTFGAAAKRRA